MTRETRRGKWRWLRHVAWVLAAKLLLILLILGGVAIFFGSGAGNPLIHGYVVKRLEKMTGGQVTLRSISIRWLSLEVKLKGLVIRGREPADTEPLFAADEVQAGLRIDSFWGRKVSLNDLLVQRPQVHIRIEKNGTSNIPVVQGVAPRKPARETLFDLHIRRLQLQNGWILYNDVRTPLAVEGDKPAAGAGLKRVRGSTDVSGDNRLAIDSLHGKAVPSVAGEHFREIYDARGWLHAGTGNPERGAIARRCPSGHARLFPSKMEFFVTADG